MNLKLISVEKMDGDWRDILVVPSCPTMRLLGVGGMRVFASSRRPSAWKFRHVEIRSDLNGQWCFYTIDVLDQ